MSLDTTSINIGESPNDGSGLALRDAFALVNSNFANVKSWSLNGNFDTLTINSRVTAANISAQSGITATNLVVTNNATLASAAVTDKFSVGSQVYNYDWVFGTQARSYAKVATLPPANTNNYDSVVLSGIIANGYVSTNKYPFLINFSNSSGFAVKYLYGPPGTMQGARIDLYREVDGSISVWAATDALVHSTLQFNITSAVGATVISNPALINSPPAGTLVWSTKNHSPSIIPTDDGITVGSISKSGTSDTGNIGSFDNKFNTVYANSFTGNAGTANKLSTARTINGVSFDGSQNITVPVDAGSIAGNSLPSNITSSSLTSVGVLTDLTVSGTIYGTVAGARLYQSETVPNGYASGDEWYVPSTKVLYKAVDAGWLVMYSGNAVSFDGGTY